MHQPLPVADEEGVRFVHREVVHHLRLVDDLDGLHFTVADSGAADVIAHFKFTCCYLLLI
jgi:hypothetical protein